MMQQAFAVVLVGFNAYLLVAVVGNIVYFRRATAPAKVKTGPFVSVIVPARDEARSIAGCLESLLRQDYADYEVIVVDDESSDATASIVAELAAADPRLQLVSGKPLPSGWLGKPHALCQAAAAARGAILLLTDADTTHSPQSVSWAVTNLRRHRADILSGYVAQEYGTVGESMVVPTMYAMMMLAPFFLVPREGSPQLAFAIGQYVVLRREALDGVGGFDAIKDSLVDDMPMAARIQAFGYRGVFLDAAGAASCRLYRGYRDAFQGIKRSIYSAVGASPLTVLLMAVLVLGFIVWPALAVLISLARLDVPSAPVAIAAGLFALQWALVVANRRAPLASFLLYPVVFLNLLVMLVFSMFQTGFGPGVEWKGRVVQVPGRASVPVDAAVADAEGRSGKVR